MTARLRILGPFLAFTALAVAWALATPLFGSPDEPAHVVKAAGVVRGQLVGDDADELGRGVSTFELPAIFASAHNISCYAFKPNVTADCLAYEGSSETVEVGTTAGRHPPFYYAIVGLPSLVETDATGIYAMRILSAIVTSALLAAAWACAAMLPKPRVVRVGIAVAVTPMVVFLAGVVNPSSWELAAATLLWVAGLALVYGSISPGLIRVAGIAAVTLALVRQLGPVWLAITIVVLAFLASTERRYALWRSRELRVWGAVVAGAALAQGAWILIAKPLDTALVNTRSFADLETADLLETSLGRAGLYYYEMIGIFGWRDTLPPEVTVLIWSAAALGIVFIGIAVARRQQALVLVALGVLTFVIPIAAELYAARDAGFYWQGRYTLPLAIGMVMLAAVVLVQRVAVPTRAIVLVGVSLAIAQWLALAQTLRRFTAGARSDDLLFWNDAAWSPPVPIAVLLVGGALAIGAWYRVLLTDDASISHLAPETVRPVDGPASVEETRERARSRG